MAWQTECVRIVRYLISDLSDPPEYSDSRLEETLLVAAQYVMKDISLSNTYLVDVDQLSLTPDPTTLSTKDDAFINLICLKAGCIIDQSTYRTKIREAGLLVKDGQSTIDTRGREIPYKELLARGLCQQYEKAKQDYQLNDFNPGRVVLGPSSGPNISIQHIDGDLRDRFY